ncbi:uncharacterized protein LOC129786562 [Lutzomyia longipalpis]|uniref:uncharacterized protein LOC129786562 n=1 Tax=Lutzomyia longipalpis TaxID=7200 RepID=UPI002483D57C|nr:uncharacterized protein LOC129786562 [Lutzomyia longipalpis]
MEGCSSMENNCARKSQVSNSFGKVDEKSGIQENKASAENFSGFCESAGASIEDDDALIGLMNLEPLSFKLLSEAEGRLNDIAYSRINNLPLRIRHDDCKVKLINAVKDYPCLYDRMDENFEKNSQMESKCWAAVAEKIGCYHSRGYSKFFKSLLNDFSIVYVILRDKELLKIGVHYHHRVFIYYDHMLFFRNQIDIPHVRLNQVQEVVHRLFRRDDLLQQSRSEKIKILIEETRATDLINKTTLHDIIQNVRINKLPCSTHAKDKNLQLIEAVREHPCLYDKTQYWYGNSWCIQQAWNEIKAKTNIENCEENFLILFENFARTFLMLRDPNHIEDGSSVPFLYYEKMLFMKDEVNFRHVKMYNDPLDPWMELDYHEMVVQEIKSFTEKEDGNDNEKSQDQENTTLIEEFSEHPEEKIIPIENIEDNHDHDILVGSNMLSEEEGNMEDVAYSRINGLPLRISSDEFEVMLINAVKEYPCRYDRMDENFEKNLQMENQCWAAVAEKLNNRHTALRCRQLFKKLFTKFSITYIILRDRELREMGLHRSHRVFIYYDHMLFFRNQIDIPQVRQNQVQTIVNRFFRKKYRRERKEIDRREVRNRELIDQTSNLDLEYVRDNHLPHNIHPADGNMRLIEAVKAQPCLYDRAHCHYKDTKHIQQAWKEIEEKTNIKNAEKKFLNLFHQFARTFVMLRDPKLVKEGLPIAFFYYEKMLFLKYEIDLGHVQKYSIPLDLNRQKKDVEKFERLVDGNTPVWQQEPHKYSSRQWDECSEVSLDCENERRAYFPLRLKWERNITTSQPHSPSSFEESTRKESPSKFITNSIHKEEDLQWGNVLHPQEVTSFFYQLSEKVTKSKIGYETFAEMKKEIEKVVERRISK